MKAKRTLSIIALAVVVLLIAGWIFLVLFLDSTVKTAVEAVLPKITGTPVTLGKANISIFSGRGTLSYFVIGNPEGFHTKEAISVGTIRVAIDVSSLFSDKIIIREIYVDSPHITYEADPSGSNIATIQDNIQKFAGPAKKETAPAKPGKKIQIDRFTIQNGKVALSATLLQGNAITAPLPPVELKNIGTGPEGATPGDVAAAVFAPVTHAVQQAVNIAGDMIRKGAGTVTEGGKTLLDGGAKGAQNALDKAKGLFKSK